MEKSATLQYINLVFIPHDCDVAPKQKSPFSSTNKKSPHYPPNKKS